MSIFRLLSLVKTNIHYRIIVVYRYYARNYIVHNLFFGCIYPNGKLYMYKVHRHSVKNTTRWGVFSRKSTTENENSPHSAPHHNRPSHTTVTIKWTFFLDEYSGINTIRTPQHQNSNPISLQSHHTHTPSHTPHKPYPTPHLPLILLTNPTLIPNRQSNPSLKNLHPICSLPLIPIPYI